MSLILGVVAVARAVVVMNVPSRDSPNFFSFLHWAPSGDSSSQDRAGLVPKTLARLWPGRAMAFLGAFLSWSVLMAITVISMYALEALSHG